MRSLKKYVVFLFMICLSYTMVYGNSIELFYDGAYHTYNYASISLYVDDVLVDTSEMAPIQFNGYTLVPAREVFEQTGALVTWKASEQKVYIDNNKNLIVLEINNQNAWVDGNDVMLDMPAKVINGKVMIPTRFVGETLGYKVVWNGGNYSINIVTKEAVLDNNTQDNNAQEDNVQDNNNQDDSNIIDNDIIDNDVQSDINDDQGLGDEEELPMIPTGDGWLNMDYITYVNSIEALKLEDLAGLSVTGITVDEKYHSKQIVVTLNNNYGVQLPEGKWFKQSGAISTLEIVNYDVSTQLIITTRTIQALKVYEQDNGIMLQCVVPSEKYDKIVVVDAGHGDQDPGAVHAGIQEKDLNLRYANALGTILKQDPNIKVYLTREDDTFLTLNERTAMANEIDPDLFISIHINSASTATATGMETYYTNKADTRNKTFATIVQNALIEEFGVRNRGVKNNTFIVTKNTKAPAILIETGFITNAQDRAMMTSSSFASQYANVIYQSILEYYNQGWDR